MTDYRLIKEFSDCIVESNYESLIVLDDGLKVISASPYFYKRFQTTPEEIEGKFIYEVYNHPLVISNLVNSLESVYLKGIEINQFEIEQEIKGAGRQVMLLSARKIKYPMSEASVILLTIKNISEKVEEEPFFFKAHKIAERIIDTIREPLVVLDFKLRVMSANRAYYQTFKETTKETEGHLFYELHGGQWNIPQLRLLIEDIIREDRNFDNFEVQKNFQAIGFKIMFVSGRGIISYQDEAKLILLSIEDVSIRRQAEEEMNRIYNAKSTFTLMVSHELRTPLTSLKQSIHLLGNEESVGELNEKQKKFLGIAERNLDRLLNLINNVLDFQKIESGKMVYRMEMNDIKSVMEEIREVMGGLVAKKQLDLILEIEDSLPQIEFDKQKIIQVLTNLVNNALKATQRGYIKLLAKQKNNFILVSIQDTGIGIRREDIPKLFEEYEQLERKDGGTGLGLVISQDIILAHSGKIWVESVFGKGTMINFVLPIRTQRKKRLEL